MDHTISGHTERNKDLNEYEKVNGKSSCWHGNSVRWFIEDHAAHEEVGHKILDFIEQVFYSEITRIETF